MFKSGCKLPKLECESSSLVLEKVVWQKEKRKKRNPNKYSKRQFTSFSQVTVTFPTFTVNLYYNIMRYSPKTTWLGLGKHKSWFLLANFHALFSQPCIQISLSTFANQREHSIFTPLLYFLIKNLFNSLLCAVVSNLKYTHKCADTGPKH